MHALHPPFDGFMSIFPIQSFFSYFLKKVLPASVGSIILEIDPLHFASKIPLFGLPKRGYRACFGYFIRSYRSSARSVRVLCASVAHQNIASRPWLVHFYPLEPDRQKRLYATHIQIYEFRVPRAVFFLLFVLDTPFFPNFIDVFWKCARRPRWEA